MNPQTRARRCSTVLLVLAALAPAPAAAQSEPQGTQTSDFWVTAGAAFATLRGDCQTCEDEFPYRHSGSILAGGGYRVNGRMDIGGEMFFMPVETASGNIRTTHIDAIAQFRPWSSQGFFLKGGAGMAFVRNWVDATGPDAINSKALSVVIGGGWMFRPADRFGLQLFATQHAGALGDLRTADSDIPDVMGNFWSLGAAIVFR